MAKKEFTYTLKLDAIVSDAQKNLNGFKKSLDQTWQGSTPPKHLLKAYEDMRLRLASLQELSKKGMVDTSDLSQVANDYKALTKHIHDLSLEFKLMTTEQKKSLLSSEEQNALKSRAAAVDAYTAALKRNEEILKKRAPLETKQTQLQNTKNQATANKAGLETRLKNLESVGGPTNMTPEAKQYLENQKQLLDIENKIAVAKRTIATETAKGTKQDGTNNLTRAKAELEKLEKQLAKIDQITGKADYDKAFEEYENSVAQVKKELKEATKTINDTDDELKDIDKTLKNLKTTTPDEEFKKLKERLKELGVEGIDSAKDVDQIRKVLAKLNKDALAKVETGLKGMEKGLEGIGQQSKEVKREIDAGTESIKEQTEAYNEQTALENRIKQFVGLAGAAQLMQRALRSSIETIKELDATMTEMAVVTDLGIGDYWNQLDEHAARASELGRSINDVYKAETLYYQQGLKTEEVVALSTETMKMATIAGLDAEDATNKMTAALRGFNMELDETNAKRVSDVYSELAAITAADVDEISSAMTKTASIASAAGMEFETTAAFLSQIIETTRESAETAGTAMKTVIARFSEVKKLQNEGIMSGQDSEGEVIDVNKIQTALRTIGISMDEFFQGTEGLDSVFLKLAERWDTLDVKTQRYIATTAAGSRQQSRFIAMMSDYARTQELVTAANNSAGASQQQFEKTVESLQHKLNALKTAWEQFSMGILESDLVKVGVDILTKFLEIINKATSAFDGLGGSIMKIMTVVSLFKLGQKLFDKFRAPMIKFFADIVKESRTTGEEATKAFVQGTQKGKEEVQSDNQETTSDEKKTIKQITQDKIGLTNIDSGRSKIGNIEAEKQKRQQRVKDAEAAIAKREKEFKDIQDGVITKKDGKSKYSPKSNQYRKAEKLAGGTEAEKKELEEAKKALADYDDMSKTVQKESVEGWKEVGKGVSQMGASVAAVGIGLSMFGGILDSLGLEEAGKAFSIFGNVVTFAGTAISGIGTLIPIVAAKATDAGITVQAAWWWLVAIVAVVALLTVGIIALVKHAQSLTLENRMKAAAEATEKAKEAAQEAKEAYDELVEDRGQYDEMQKNLENLTYGTKEWKEALHEVNQQVLELIQTYPELAKYLERGDEGQLTISDEGWDALLDKQRKAVNNTQSVVLSRQIDEQKLKIEEEAAKYTRATTVYRNSDGYSYTNEKANPDLIWNDPKNTYLSEGLRSALEEIYITQNSSLEEQEGKVAELAKQFGLTEEAIKKAGKALEEDKDKLVAIADQTENIARASLTAQASDELLNHELGDEVIDAFAQSVGGKGEEEAINKYISEMNADRESGKLGDSEMMKKIGQEYGINFEAGSDKQNLQEIYAAMTGKSMEDVKAEKMSKEQLTKAIAEMQVNSDRNTKMEKYLKKLDSLDSSTARDVSSLFSDDGHTMSSNFVDEAIKDDGTFDKTAIEKRAAAMNMTVDEWAESVGKTTEDFWKEAEENARSAKETNKRTYDQLNRVLGKSDKEIKNFGDNVKLSIENQAGLAEKLVGVTQVAGQEAGNTLKAGLDSLLGVAGDNADELAGVLSTVNWHDAESLEELPTILEEMGISVPTDKLNNFIQQIQNTGIVVDTVNLEKLNNDLTNTRELIKSIQSGEQGRTFTKENYDTLVAANEDIANQFVQIGDEFHYVGTSLQEVSDTLKQNMVMELGKASYQLEKQIQVGKSIQDFSQGRSENQLNALNGTNNWTEDQKRQYLEEYRAYAVQNGVDTLSYVTNEKGQSLGMSLGMDFDEASEEQMDAYIAGLVRLEGELEKNTTELSQTLSNQRIAQYRMESASSIVSNASTARTANDEVKADEYSKALSIEAATTGLIAESVISEYNELVGRDLESLNSDELARMSTLEATMKSAIEDNTVAIQDLQTINEMTNRVAQALETARQHEIDELSNINDSINEANQAMVNKLQQQINETRKQRQNEKTEEAIADKQSRLAYLMADTSGAGSLEAQALQEQILAEQESYQDTLIDQSLQKLSDENAAAADQRERQIAILEAQLAYAQESGELMREAEMITQQSLAQINQGVNPLETQMYDVLAAEEEINGGMVTGTQQEEFNRNFNEKAVAAADAQERLDEGVSKVATQDTLANLNNWLQGQKDKTDEEEKKGITAVQKDDQDQAVRTMANEAISTTGGLYFAKNSDAYTKQLKAFQDAGGGTEEDFQRLVYEAGGEDLAKKTFMVAESEAVGNGAKLLDTADADNTNKGKDAGIRNIGGVNYQFEITAGNSDLGKAMELAQISSGSIVKYDGNYYYYHGGKAYPMRAWNGWAKSNKQFTDIPSDKFVPKKYKTGGLADFTGPAWLDGTKSHPELVLNQRDTQNFIQLKDILADIMSNPSDSKKPSGDNYYNIEISVEELKDDYDVEQLANKIRSMLHDDAMYRNVNAISHIR